VESKQFRSGVQLDPGDLGTGRPVQMSDDWTNTFVPQKLIGTGNSSKMDIGYMIIGNPTLVEKYVIAVNRKTRNIEILKLQSFQ
jgi:hypothetical protein